MKKKIIIIFVGVLFFSTASIVPTINGSEICKIIEKYQTKKAINNNFLFYGKNINDKLLDCSVQELISFFKNDIKNINDINVKISMMLVENLLKKIPNIYGNDILDLPSKYLFDFMLYFNPTLDENIFNKFFTKDLIPIHKEIMMILQDKKSLNQLSKELTYLISYAKEDITDKLTLGPTITYFSEYKSNYSQLNDFWHSRGRLPTYGLLGYNEDTYADWTNERDARDEGVVIASIVLIIMGILVILLGSDYFVDAIGCIILILVLIYDVTLLVYVINVYEIFDMIQAAEPDIVVHVVYEDENQEYVGIPGLEGQFIKAVSADGINICKQKNNTEAWQESFFTYYLGSSDYMEELYGEEGWYSLRERDSISNIYEKAPCPPGNWTLIIGGNQDWKEKSEPVNNIIGQEVVIIDPFILESNQK